MDLPEYTPKPNPTISEIFEEPITLREVEVAIKKLKSRKAVGNDEIPNEFLVNGGPKLQEALTQIFRLIQDEEWVPPELTREKVKLIHKGKSRTDLDNYRGIALTSNFFLESGQRDWGK